MTATRNSTNVWKLMAIAALVVGAAILALRAVAGAAGTDFIPMSSAHNTAHSPGMTVEAAERVQAVMTVWTTTGPPNDSNTKCMVMKLAGIAVRWLVWRQTGVSVTGIPRGDLSWFDKIGWQDSYPNKSGATLTNVPTDLRSNSQVTMTEVSCSGPDFPNLPPFSPAQ